MTTPTADSPKFVEEQPGIIGMIIDETGTIVAREHYRDHTTADDTKQRAFVETVVDKDYRGQGLAGKLVKHALDDAIDEGFRIIAICPYVKRWVEKQDDPRYQNARDTPRPEHFQ